MGDASSLACPQCGAPANPDSACCPYCQTALALVACPVCFGKIFKGARHCSHCGAASTRQEVGTAGGTCPHCRVSLLEAKVGSVLLGECGKCGGVWADAAAFERICSEREEQAVVLGTAFPAPAAASPEVKPAARYWPCPKCSRL